MLCEIFVLTRNLEQGLQVDVGWNFAVHDVVDNPWRQVCQIQVFINRALVAVFCGGKRTGQKIEQRHLTRLNKYAASPELCTSRANQTKYRIKPGTRMIKKYKGREYTIEALGNDTFRYNGAIYKTLSAIAMTITGHKVSGYDFFGLYTKRGKE